MENLSLFVVSCCGARRLPRLTPRPIAAAASATAGNATAAPTAPTTDVPATATDVPATSGSLATAVSRYRREGQDLACFVTDPDLALRWV